MREEHPCPCESILSLLPFVFRRTECDACLGEGRRGVPLVIF